MQHPIKKLIGANKFHEALIRMKVLLGINIDEFSRRLLSIETLESSKAKYAVITEKYSELAMDMMRAIDERE
jgi:hypothetical protein